MVVFQKSFLNSSGVPLNGGQSLLPGRCCQGGILSLGSSYEGSGGAVAFSS